MAFTQVLKLQAAFRTFFNSLFSAENIEVPRKNAFMSAHWPWRYFDFFKELSFIFMIEWILLSKSCRAFPEQQPCTGGTKANHVRFGSRIVVAGISLTVFSFEQCQQFYRFHVQPENMP